MLSWVLPEVKPERSRMSVSRVAEAATEGDSVKCIFESQFVIPLLRFEIGQIASMDADVDLHSECNPFRVNRISNNPTTPNDSTGRNECC